MNYPNGERIIYSKFESLGCGGFKEILLVTINIA